MSRQAARDDILPRGGNGVVGTAPGGLYPCKPGGKDDYAYIFCSRGNEEHWKRLCNVIGRQDLADDPRMANGDLRFQHKEEVDQAITDWTMQNTKTEVMEAIASQKVPCGAVYNTYELMRDEDFLSRGMMQEIDQPKRGKVTVAGWPLKMSGSHVPIRPAPLHGGNNEDVYGEWLGIEANEVRSMRERGEI